MQEFVHGRMINTLAMLIVLLQWIRNGLVLFKFLYLFKLEFCMYVCMSLHYKFVNHIIRYF